MSGEPPSLTSERRPVRLVVPSPDGQRILGRPNGLAGWALPVVALAGPSIDWDEEALARAAAVVGATVQPVRDLGEGSWAMRAEGRIAAAGNTWIGAEEANRFGNDAAIVLRWFSQAAPSTET